MEQPFPSVPVTVYVVCVFGETVPATGFQVYKLVPVIPVALIRVLFPLQIVGIDAFAITVGKAFTTIVPVAFALPQPPSNGIE